MLTCVCMCVFVPLKFAIYFPLSPTGKIAYTQIFSNAYLTTLPPLHAYFCAERKTKYFPLADYEGFLAWVTTTAAALEIDSAENSWKEVMIADVVISEGYASMNTFISTFSHEHTLVCKCEPRLILEGSMRCTHGNYREENPKQFL